MRKIILMMPVSVDRFIEGPEREFDWHKADELPPPHGLHRKGRRSLRQGGRPLARAPVMGWNDHDRGPEADAE
jgi:hypothetical protein